MQVSHYAQRAQEPSSAHHSFGSHHDTSPKLDSNQHFAQTRAVDHSFNQAPAQVPQFSSFCEAGANPADQVDSTAHSSQRPALHQAEQVRPNTKEQKPPVFTGRPTAPATNEPHAHSGCMTDCVQGNDGAPSREARPIQDLVVIELFAGSGNLSKAFRNIGVQVVPIDTKEAPQIKIVKLNLLHKGSVGLVMRLLETHKVFACAHGTSVQHQQPEASTAQALFSRLGGV